MNTAHRLLRYFAGLFAVATALAQGTLDFRNYNPSQGLDVPFCDPRTGERLGTAWYAQLYAGAMPDSLAPVGAPVFFKDSPASGAGTGYAAGGKVFVPTVAEGAQAYVQWHAWEVAGGDSFEAAQAAGKAFGVAPVIVVTTGGDNLSPPVVPAPLTGLQAWTCIPEPAPAWLLLVGGGAWLCWRQTASKRRPTPDSNPRSIPGNP